MRRLFMFSGFVYCSGMYWLVILKVSIFSRFFLIKWADRGLVVHGRLNTDLFNVKGYCLCLTVSIFSFQLLFWINNICMMMFATANYPVSFKLLPKYPFNNMKGNVCAGTGIQRSRTTDKEMTCHMLLFFGAVIYRIQIYYISGKTSRFLKKFSPKGSGAMFNGHFR